jgi:hypothetical protein
MLRDSRIDSRRANRFALGYFFFFDVSQVSPTVIIMPLTLANFSDRNPGSFMRRN